MEKKMIDAMSKLPSKPLRSITILVVDDDPTCLSIVAALLKSWKYEVVTVKHAIDALCALRLKNDYFDLVVTDIHMPDMNGFELQRIIKEEFNLPVVFMSADDKDSVIFEGLANGAAYFIVKPVTPGDLKNLWQYAVAKKAGKGNLFDQELIITDPTMEIDATRQIVLQATSENQLVLNNNNNNIGSSSTATTATAAAAAATPTTKRRCPSKSVVADQDSVPNKKIKVVWSNGLHNQFLQAVRTLGLNRAVPKKILELMNVPGLTRENIASHLQKYRIFLKRVSEAGCRIQSSAERRLSSQTSLESMFNYHGQPLLSSEKSLPLDSPLVDPIQSSNSSEATTYSISRNVLGQQSKPLLLTNNINNQAIDSSTSTTTVKLGSGNPNPNPSTEKMPVTNGYSDYNVLRIMDNNSSSDNIKPASSYAGFRLGSDGCLVGIRNSNNYASKVVSSNNVNDGTGGHDSRSMNRSDNNSSGFILGQVVASNSTLSRNRDQTPQNPTLVDPSPNNIVVPPINTNNNNNIIMLNNNHRAGINDGCDFGLINNNINIYMNNDHHIHHHPNSFFLNQDATNLQVQPPNYMPRQGVEPNNILISSYDFGQTSQQREEISWDHLDKVDCFASVLEENTTSHPILLEDEEFLRSVLGYDDDNNNFGSY